MVSKSSSRCFISIYDISSYIIPSTKIALHLRNQFHMLPPRSQPIIHFIHSCCLDFFRYHPMHEWNSNVIAHNPPGEADGWDSPYSWTYSEASSINVSPNPHQLQLWRWWELMMATICETKNMQRWWWGRKRKDTLQNKMVFVVCWDAIFRTLPILLRNCRLINCTVRTWDSSPTFEVC